ncbi:glycosyltransferase family 2 protein [Rosistilla oblonga]|uniref:Glycosyl transferase family 2 n=1 Tax=Rosistilla oblonga TaxID=2527990 RepID=A0A518IR00_9BACT|nr:glycosyltransferase family 2 protein [Rosistilla oblonga]QDV55500.1 hypothetical protein Mal33_14760 [Rosistilla oblonga]
MKVSGFTIARNAIHYDYPVVESITSVLPLVDEMIVAVGESCDGTRALIQSIDSPKIRIIDTVWDETSRQNGTVLADQTNLALQHCTGDWCFYIQADEVIHEADLDRIGSCMRRHLKNPRIEGLSFRYHHFRADYNIRDPLPYRRQVRIVRAGVGVQSVGDACGFAVENRKLAAASTGAWVYHYGYVKPPKTMAAKTDYFTSLYDGRQVAPGEQAEAEAYAWNLKTCEPFRGSHPRVMEARIAAKDWETPEFRMCSRWYNPNFWSGLLYKNTRTFRRWVA